MDSLLSSVAHEAGQWGLDVSGATSLALCNAVIPETTGCRLRPAGPCRGDALVVVLGNTRALWDCLLRHLADDPSVFHDPVDTYVARAIESLLGLVSRLNVLRPRVLPASEKTDQVESGWGYTPLQRMAVAAGVAYLDETAHLALHPSAGPWFSLRAALVFDAVPFTAAPPVPVPDPVPAERRAVVEAAFKSAMDASADPSAGRDAWRHWVALRDAVTPDHPMRFSDDQIEYHYTQSRQALERALAGYRLAARSTGE